MHSKRITFVTIVLFFATVSTAQSGSRNTEWKRVQHLKPHTPVLVELRSGETIRGNLATTANDTALRLEQQVAPDAGLLVPRVLARNDIRRVYKVWTPMPKLARQMIGGAIGLAAAIGIGAAVDSRQKSHEDDGLVGVALAPVGVITGVAIGGKIVRNPKERLVYEVP